MDRNSILVAGAGIGGLTTALCLARSGFTVRVLEQASELGEIGAGIQLSPNASRVLHHLGLEKQLQHIGFLPEGTQFRHWRKGHVIGESELGISAVQRFGAPYYHIHRGDLLSVLAQAANDSENVSIHTSARVEVVQQSPIGVEVNTSDGSFEGRGLIGADGIHSVVREFLWGEEAPRFTGNVAWRALVPTARLPEGLVRPMSTAWWGPGKHFVHYYVRGGEMVNCVCVVEKSGWETESWTEPGELSELQSDFRGWHSDVQTLIECADASSLYKWALYDREPMKQWGHERVTLLGDACHPTLPFMAQGAAMAIEDAAVLAQCMSKDKLIPALAKYESLRRDRTASIQLGSRRNAKVFHLSGIKAWLRNRAVRAAGDRVTSRLFSYNALEVVNE